jgi:hypothetical protein
MEGSFFSAMLWYARGSKTEGKTWSEHKCSVKVERDFEVRGMIQEG